jgi:nitric oxide reductase activation protein
MPETAFAASVHVDLSGSMGNHVQSAGLYDAAMVLSDTFSQLDIAHEVRGFSGGSFQFKSLEEPTFNDERASSLADSQGLSSVGAMGGTMYNTTGELAVAALSSRKEKNRLMVVLSDGGFGDHGDSAHTLKHARNSGIITFGLFLGSEAPRETMDQLYGSGNWACINSLTEMPKRVGERLAILYSNLVQQNRYG